MPYSYSTKLVTWFVSLLLFSLVSVADAGAYSFGFNWVDTEAGMLDIQTTRAGETEVRFEKQLLFASDDTHYSWYVVAAYPAMGKAHLVLLGSDHGNNYCPASHRVLEIQSNGQPTWTGDFGGCAEHEAIRLSSEAEIVALNNPKFVNGEWLIGLNVYDKKAKRERQKWYRYKNGRVTLDGKTVAKGRRLG